MIEQLYPYIIQTVQVLINQRQLPNNISPEDALNSDNWNLNDVKECIITQEVNFLFEFRIIFLQIEIKVKGGQVEAINIIKDLEKRITYYKE